VGAGPPVAPIVPPKHPFACKGQYTNLSLVGGLVVPSGVYCVLETSVVTGSVRVDAGGSFASVSSNIYGNLVGEPGSGMVDVNGRASGGFDVRGNVDVRDGTDLYIDYAAHIVGNVGASNTDVSFQKGAVVDGNVSIVGAPGQVFLSDSSIGGYLVLLGNQPTIDLDTLKIGGNLVCFGNGGVNLGPNGITVAGQEFGQCAGL
jgi:hypothetical protein